MLNKSNCLIAQSGGPTVVINSSLSGVISAAMENPNIDIVYGAINGIQGVLSEKVIPLNDTFKDKTTLETLKTSPAMYLGSCRYKLQKIDEDIATYEQIFRLFKKLQIKCFFYIGGNDSMDTVYKLTQYAKKINFEISIIGIPKTIDNDLCSTDHTPGFGSAAKYVATSILEIAHDAYIYDFKSVTIVEIMGRNAGWLTASSALARNTYNAAPHLIYLPEKPFSSSDFIEDINIMFRSHKNIIVAVSEGIKDENGQYISSQSSLTTDSFAHPKLSGTAKHLENIIKNMIGCKVRSIELNVLQRSAMHIASLTDINEAFELGVSAVNNALNGLTGKMLTLNRISNSPYKVQIGYIDIEEVAAKEKTIPLSWINDAGNDITRELLDYMRPLIEGEPTIKYKNGIPEYLSIDHLK